MINSTKVLLTSLTACLTGLAAQGAFGASSWLSSVTFVEDGANDTHLAANLPQSTPLNAQSTQAIFNLTISIEENPQGDDDYSHDPGAADDAQNHFEDKIEEFAYAVYEMTNAKHKIGKVTIFREFAQQDNTDVKWTKDCPEDEGPRANPSGFGVKGHRINFCTNWPKSYLMDDSQGAGYTLAHEWGHYTYGVYDEYIGDKSCTLFGLLCPRESSPRADDVPSIPSIMNNQWKAAGRSADLDFLEFSTDSVEPYKTQADGDDKNAHARVFGESGWKTLARDTTNDPKFGWMSPRTHFSNLVEPSTSLEANRNRTDALSELEIIWAGDQVVELMIDTSGSMSGPPIDSARTAGRLLVGQMQAGKNAIGVGRFTSGASQVFAIADVPDPDTGVIAAAQAAVNGLSAGGGTNIEAAALRALSEVQNFDNGQRPSVVFLLTDGQSSVNVQNVVNQYKAAGVALITFGFGSNVNATLLQSLATGTGGQYFFSPTNQAAITRAFLAANAAFSSSSVVSSSSAPTAAGATDVRTIHLDSTLTRATISVNYQLAASDISLRLLDPSGADTGASFNCTAASEIACDLEVDVPTMGSGAYELEVTNNTAAAKDISVLVSGAPGAFDSYHLAVSTTDARYPQELALEASVSKGPALKGVDVNAVLTRPDGSVTNVILIDDGRNADRLADDGVYSASIPYFGDGTYTAVVHASNERGRASTTFEGVLISVGEDGSAPTPASQRIREPFTRAAVVTMSVDGFANDDHADDPGVPGSCTAIVDDNTDTLGRIDRAGDIDCFSFQPSSASAELVVRATALRQDIEPVLRIYDALGSTELFSATLDNSDNPDSGVIARISAASVDPAGHVLSIEHADASAATGGYAISVGKPLTSDDSNERPQPSASCDGVAATLVGTPGDDILHGTPGDDVIAALAGDDIVYGKGGNDTICGFGGDDKLYGGGGNDRLLGGPGDDLLAGSHGDDRLYGGGGNDRLVGSYGNDRLVGEAGDDRLYGNSGDDRLEGGGGSDLILGSYGADFILGGAGSDTIRAGSNNDRVSGGSGRDTIDGGSGHDTLRGNDGGDWLYGGIGNDRLIGGGGHDVCTAGGPSASPPLDAADAAALEDAALFTDGSDLAPPAGEFDTAHLLHPTEESAAGCEVMSGY